MEEQLREQSLPLVHAWRYRHCACPKTTTHTHAFDMIQAPTGYTQKQTWILPKTPLDAVPVIMDEIGNFKDVQRWSNLATISHGVLLP